MSKLCGSCFPEKRPESSHSILRPIGSRSSSVVVGPKIIIVGGGAAGLACGVKLIECGIRNVTILEAQSRIGGRIHTIPFGDNNIDLGAQWVHGEKDNIVYEMVRNQELLTTSGDVYVSFQCVRSNGDVVDDNDVQKLKDLLGDIFVNKRTEMAEFEGSFGEFLEYHFFETLKDETYEDIDRVIAEEFFENFKKMESSESSLALDEISAKGFLEYWDCEGDYMLGWKERGFQEFLRVLTKSKYDSISPLGVLASKIIFDAKVQLIQWEREDGSVRVLCEGADEPYDADNVVVTVSLGVLKQNANEMFEPPLPAQKMQAIENLGYGNVFKIFIEFPHKFWPPKWTGFTTLWLKEDVEQLVAEDRAWLQEIYGFYLVNFQPRVLQAWAVGSVVPVLENMAPNELEENLMYLLNRFLPVWNIPEPVAVVTSGWSTNPNFLGAYSFRTIAAEVNGTGSSTLAMPLNTTLNVPLDGSEDSSNDSDVPNARATGGKSARLTIKPTVLFAGEATSTHYFSTVHGAVESGIREAQRIAGYYEYET